MKHLCFLIDQKENSKSTINDERDDKRDAPPEFKKCPCPKGMIIEQIEH